MVAASDVGVVTQATRALGELCRDPKLARKLVDAKALQRATGMISDASTTAVQICGLRMLSNLAFASEPISRELFSETLLDRLMRLVRDGRDDDVRARGLEAMGNLAFERSNRRAIARYARALLSSYALGEDERSNDAGGRVRTRARVWIYARTGGNRRRGVRRRRRRRPRARSTRR
jgi:hypothetical protein